MRHDLPFPLLGLDSDNGSEFINDNLYRYCVAEQITFTRSRPYRKNDQAHVEQKNWSVVRHTVGYDRMESQEELALIIEIYQDLRLYINFFQPVLKLIRKERVEGKQAHYDTAKTPFSGVLARVHPCEDLSPSDCQYVQLNPVTFRANIDANVASLWKLVR